MRRLLSFGMALATVGTALAAQQALPPAIPEQQPAPPAVNQLTPEQQKDQVRSFAAVLRAAVEGGGQRIQQRIFDIIRDAPPLAMAGEPDVLGVPYPDGGFVFYVQVPDILPVYLTMFQVLKNRQEARPVGTNPVERVGDEAAKGADPVFDPDREYGEFVRAGLIEAMIENSQALGITEGRLVVIASVTAAVRRDPLNTRRSLILSISADDLAAYRQGRLTKDEIRKRIVDRRF